MNLSINKTIKLYKIKELPKIVWGNIVFFTYILCAVISGVIFRHNDPNWSEMKDIRLEYDLLFGLGFSILCITSIIGLLKRKEWGRQFAISLNSVLFFTSFIMRVGIYFWTLISCGEGVVQIDLDAAVIAFCSIFFLFALTRNNIKTIYKAGACVETA